MAIARAQSASNSGPNITTLTTTFAGAPTSGNPLIAAIITRAGTLTNPTSFTTGIQVENTTESDWGRIAWKTSAGSETAIQWTGMSGTDAAAAKSWELSGAETSSYIDKTASTGRSTGASSIQTGSTGTLSQAAEFAIAIACIRATVTSPSIDSSFTDLDHIVGGSGGVEATLLTAEKVTAATTALNPTFSWTGSVTCWSMILTVLEDSGGAPQSVTTASPISGTTLFAPTVKYRMSLPTISATVVRTPTITTGAIGISLPTIGTTFNFHGASVKYVIAPPAIAATTTLRTPIVGSSLRLPTISSTTISTPHVKYKVSLPTISGTQIFTPTVALGGALSLPAWVSTTTLYTPTLRYKVSLPTISATVVRTPSVAYGIVTQTISSTVVRTPTISFGSLTLSLPRISGTSLFSPTVHQAENLENYFRRYLNDRTVSSTPGPAVSPAVVSENSFSTYVRRYLNDKA